MTNLNLPERITQLEPILLTEVGSTAHGISVGDDDLDVMGVFLKPAWAILGMRTIETTTYRTAAERTGKENARSEPGDLDLTMHSLRKFCRLALKGNPTIQMLLFAEPLWASPVGRELLANRDLFASIKVAHAFRGYMAAQYQRLTGERGQKGVRRLELVEAHGYDTKYAAHVLRLGFQGIEYAGRGAFSVPLRGNVAELIRAVRAGEVSERKMLYCAEYLTEALNRAIERNPAGLPARPDAAAVDRWVQSVYAERIVREHQLSIAA